MRLPISIATSIGIHIILIASLFMITMKAPVKQGTFDVNIVGPLQSLLPSQPSVLPIPPTNNHANRRPGITHLKKAAPTIPAHPSFKSPGGLLSEGKGILPQPYEAKKTPETLPGSVGQSGKGIPGAAGAVPRQGLIGHKGKGLFSELFDKETIEQLAKKEPPKDNSLTFDTKEFMYLGYMRQLKERIEGIWQYPTDAASHGVQGDLYIKFTILKNGRLGGIELVRTSGREDLDNAAMRALKDAAPFWPLPEDWKKDSISITGHFIYSISGTYIR